MYTPRLILSDVHTAPCKLACKIAFPVFLLLWAGQTFAGDDAIRPAIAISLTSSLSASPAPVPEGAPVVLSVGAFESLGGVLSYTWNFGDGTDETTSKASATHAYPAAGVYGASVSIGNATGYIVSEKTVVVTPVSAARALALAAVSKNAQAIVKVAPFDVAKISGAFDPTKHHYSIGFVFSKDKKTGDEIVAKVPVLAEDVTPESLSVVVPPFVRKGFQAGKANLVLITDNVASNEAFATISITDLPKYKNRKAPGSPTISYLRMGRLLMTTARPKLAGNFFINPALLADIDTNSMKLASMISEYQTAVDGKTKDKMTLATLAQSDRFVLGILGAGAQISDSTFAAACLNWQSAMQSAKDSSDPALLAAEADYVDALLASAGVTGVSSRGVFASAIKVSLGILTVTGAGIGLVATAAGGVAAGAATVAAVGTAVIVIGATAATTVAVTAGVAYVVGDKKIAGVLAEDAGKISVEVGKNAAQNVVLGAGGKILTIVGTGKSASETITNVVGGAIDVTNATSDLQDNLPKLQGAGSFTAGYIPSGSSYFVAATGTQGNAITVSVSGSDGYSASFSGTGQVKSGVIPAGAPGVVDTIVCKDTVTGETQSFTFKF